MIDAGQYAFPSAELDYVEFELAPGEGIGTEVIRRKKHVGPIAIVYLKIGPNGIGRKLPMYDSASVARLRQSLGLAETVAGRIEPQIGVA